VQINCNQFTSTRVSVDLLVIWMMNIWIQLSIEMIFKLATGTWIAIKTDRMPAPPTAPLPTQLRTVLCFVATSA